MVFLPNDKSDPLNEDAYDKLVQTWARPPVVVIGAGISKSVGLPDWIELLKQIAGHAPRIKMRQELRRQLSVIARTRAIESRFDNAQRLRRVASELRRALGADEFARLASSNLQVSTYVGQSIERSSLLKHLLKLPLRLIVTTNFDHVLEHALELNGMSWESMALRTPDEFERVIGHLSELETSYSSERKLVLHVHGAVAHDITSSERQNIALTTEDFTSIYRENGALPNLLARIFARPAVFIGSSMADDCLLEPLADLSRQFNTPKPFHFTVQESTGLNAHDRDWYARKLCAHAVYYDCPRTKDRVHLEVFLMNLGYRLFGPPAANRNREVESLLGIPHSDDHQRTPAPRSQIALGLTDVGRVLSECKRKFLEVRPCLDRELSEAIRWVFVHSGRISYKDEHHLLPTTALSATTALQLDENNYGISYNDYLTKIKRLIAIDKWSVVVGIGCELPCTVSIAFSVTPDAWWRVHRGELHIMDIEQSDLQANSGFLLIEGAAPKVQEQGPVEADKTIALFHRTVLYQHLFLGVGLTPRGGPIRFLAAVNSREHKAYLVAHGFIAHPQARRMKGSNFEIFTMHHFPMGGDAQLNEAVNDMRLLARQIYRSHPDAKL